jgi:hypothetical protein
MEFSTLITKCTAQFFGLQFLMNYFVTFQPFQNPYQIPWFTFTFLKVILAQLYTVCSQSKKTISCREWY